MSLRIAPPASHPTQTTNTNTRLVPNTASKGAPSAPGLPDTLRDNITLQAPRGAPSTQAALPASTHPLEARLLAWRQTQDAMKMETLRRTYGIAEPIRRGMELKIVGDGTFRPAVLGGNKGGNLHQDILVLGGRDTEVGWEDVFQGLLAHSLLFLSPRPSGTMLTDGLDLPLGDDLREPPSFHDEMEKRLRMD
ncbi:proteasome maturation factor UMP1-domain-containing protein [Aspergillus egyptiacus]|nr:proteasome maturation factor UMP1-domain-containing protein [Aspergillus egyptiacus]